MAIALGQQRLFDGLAIGASILCLIHCLLLPMVIVMLPALAAFLAVPEEFHLWALVFAAPTSLFALVRGYPRHHWIGPALMVLPGLVLLALGALAATAAWLETALTVPGAILLALGHALNWRALRHAGTRAGKTPER